MSLSNRLLVDGRAVVVGMYSTSSFFGTLFRAACSRLFMAKLLGRSCAAYAAAEVVARARGPSWRDSSGQGPQPRFTINADPSSVHGHLISVKLDFLVK